jgi:hypothetical protein
MMLIIQLRHSLSKRLDSGSRAIFPTMHRDIHVTRPLKASLNLVVDLRGTLTEICPLLWMVCKAMFIGSFSSPYYTGGCTSGVETGVRAMAFVGLAELAMDFGGEFSFTWFLTSRETTLSKRPRRPKGRDFGGGERHGGVCVSEQCFEDEVGFKSRVYLLWRDVNVVAKSCLELSS